MELLRSSPGMRIKRYNGHWQEFIEREHSTVDHLLEESFAKLCRDIEENLSNNNDASVQPHRLRAGSTGPATTREPPFSTGSLSRPRPAAVMASRTMPRSPVKRFGPEKPPGIEELETLYAPMKSLDHPLPNARYYQTNGRMPALHPIDNPLVINEPRDDDQMSEVCSIMGEIPPPLAPIQSHAVLEESLGHEIPPLPRTPGVAHKFYCPPLPPKRSSSRLSIRPSHLNLKDSGIYATPQRTSLMSTGSSESSGSTASGPEATPLTPATPSDVFAWPNYAVWRTSSPDEELRSVSQIGEPPDSESDCSGGPSVNTSMTSSSGVYVKMHPIFSPTPGNSKESDYMSVLYDAVQRQGGGGSVETAMSPYIHMSGNVKLMPNANAEGIVYAQPGESVAIKRRSSFRGVLPLDGVRKNKKAKAMVEFKELLQEVARKRQYRIGLNLFNTKPDMGIEYLVQLGFIELSPPSVAKFLHQHSGLSKEKVGEYLGNLQNPFAMKVLSCFMEEFNFAGLRIDKAMRRLLEFVRVPGEAQKIEKVMEQFGRRFVKCNPGFANKLKSADSVVTLAFAVMLLNTDLHTPNIKAEKKMSVQDFMNNLRGVDGGADFDPKLLKGIYKGIKKQEFVGGADHALQTQLLLQSIQGKKPSNLAEPHRRLVCLCRLSEVVDISARKGVDHPRDIFLFNDLLVVTKQSSKSTKQQPVYSYRDAFELRGLEVTLFHTPVFDFGIQISRKADNAVLVTLNAGSEHDRYKFVMDLQESIFEMDQMEEAKAKLIYK